MKRSGLLVVSLGGVSHTVWCHLGYSECKATIFLKVFKGFVTVFITSFVTVLLESTIGGSS